MLYIVGLSIRKKFAFARTAAQQGDTTYQHNSLGHRQKVDNASDALPLLHPP